MLRPGGRLAVAVRGPRERNPWLGDLGGWVIHPERGRVLFQSLLVGGRVQRVTPDGRHRAI